MLLKLILADLRLLTPRDRRHLALYAVIIFAPLVLAFLLWLWYSPSLDQIIEYSR